MQAGKVWNKEKQLQFLEKLASTLNVKSPKDWGMVTAAIVRKQGGEKLLKAFNGSLFSALTSTFPCKNLSIRN